MRNFLLVAISIGIFVSLTTTLQAQKKSKSSPSSSAAGTSSKVIATLGPQKITVDELEAAFKKNMNRKFVRLSDVARDSVMDFLKLYVNYRLKVSDAIDRGIDKDSAVTVDLAQNRKLLAETFYFDKKVVEPAVEKTLERRKKEMKVAIIVVTPVNNDTAKALARANRLLKLVQSGADFGKIARDSSDDKETGSKDGELPFITSGRVLKPVENAAYSIKPGEIYPSIIRTRGVYFIVKLIQSEPRVKVVASHILITTTAGQSVDESTHKADSLLKLLKAGASFAELARKNSDDPSSRDRGGQMQPYCRSTGFDKSGEQLLMPEFERALYALKDGQISGKVITDYGIHIIRRDSTFNFLPDEEKEQIKRDYKRLYLEDDKRTMLDSLKNAWGYKLNLSGLTSFLESVDTMRTTLDTTWNKRITIGQKALSLYSTPEGTITIGAFVDSIAKRADIRATSLNHTGVIRSLDKILEPKLVKRATENLEHDYPEFSTLMKDFRDGILLFRVEEKEVWSKLKFDSAAARRYYDSTKTRWKTDVKYDFSEIFVKSDSLATAIRKRIDGGESFAELAAEYTERPNMKDKKGHYNIPLSAKENKAAAVIERMGVKAGEGSVIGPEKLEQKYVLLQLHETVPPRPKTFEEAIPDFAPAFQDVMQKHLTEQWLERIRKKFPTSINNAVFSAIFEKK
ncbi:peptidylprolyl isomerase [Ignavibacteria bacterium]|nr:peptidylprolyl isomerase [Bacteroidota bacterium]MCZ2133078.1 peptidylprolyl isomerase [Bacteroidota bacterium]